MNAKDWNPPFWRILIPFPPPFVFEKMSKYRVVWQIALVPLIALQTVGITLGAWLICTIGLVFFPFIWLIDKCEEWEQRRVKRQQPRWIRRIFFKAT